MNYPLVSILMNSHNGAKYLYESINSLIEQTYENWELIFYDNYSTDSTKIIIDQFKDHRIKYFYSSELLTLGQARKKAETFLSGDLIGILDSDDIWLKDKLEKQIIHFNDKEVGLIFTASIFFNNKKQISRFPFNKFIKKNFYFDLLKRYQIPLETILINKKYFDMLDYRFDSTFSSISDFDILIRLSKICKTVYLPTITAKWRYHIDSDTNKFPLKFVEEKSLWINKMLGKIGLNNQEIKLLKDLKKKNHLEKSRLLIVYNTKLIAFNYLINNFYFNISWFLNLLLIFMPFSKIFLKKRYMKGF